MSTKSISLPRDPDVLARVRFRLFGSIYFSKLTKNPRSNPCGHSNSPCTLPSFFKICYSYQEPSLNKLGIFLTIHYQRLSREKTHFQATNGIFFSRLRPSQDALSRIKNKRFFQVITGLFSFTKTFMHKGNPRVKHNEQVSVLPNY